MCPIHPRSAFSQIIMLEVSLDKSIVITILYSIISEVSDDPSRRSCTAASNVALRNNSNCSSCTNVTFVY